MAIDGRLDYTRRDFSQLVDAALEYVKHYIPAIKDTTRSNPGVRLIRLLAGVVDVLLRYLDLAFNERSLFNALQLRSQILNVQILNYKLAGPTGATGTVTFTQTNAGAASIPQWQVIRTNVSPSRTYVTTESASPPGLGFTVDLPVVQGNRVTSELLAQASDGSEDQTYLLLRRRPIKSYIQVYVNAVEWTRVDDLLDSGPNDQVFEVTYDQNMFAILTFGDNENGAAPELGDQITASYVATDGVAGEVDAGRLTVLSGLAGYTVTNASGTTGASDGDTAESIAKAAPAQFNALRRAVTADDFEALANDIAEVYSAQAYSGSGYTMTVRIVPVGGGSPSQSLLDSVYNTLQPKALDNTALVVDGFNLAYMLVTCRVRLLSRSVSKQAVRTAITNAVNSELNYTNQEVGEAWAPSDFYALVEDLDDVDLVDASRFTRVPRVVANSDANLAITGMSILDDCDYSSWGVYRKSATEFYVYRDEEFVGEGTVGVEWVSPGNDVSFLLGSSVQVSRTDGSTGQCKDPGTGIRNLFEDLGALFLTNGVQAGDVLTITGGDNAGTYIVAIVSSETQLLIATEFPVGPTTNEVWEVSYGDVINNGAVWTFKTSRAVGPVQIDDDEFPQNFTDYSANLDISLYYPDEWEYV